MSSIRNCTYTLILVLLTGRALAVGPSPIPPSPEDRCATCGMFVQPFPTFLAEIAMADGSHVFFDGAKDLFKYYLKLHKEEPQMAETIRAIFVTDYYSVEMVDGESAYYVAGSDVYGPMGPELVAFRSEEEAREFKRDHKGKKVLAFREVDEQALELLK